MIGNLCITGTLCASTAIAQSTAPPPDAVFPAKPLAFEVGSIRQNVVGGKVLAFGATPDGFRMVNMPLGPAITAAYVPQSGQALNWEQVGFPVWANKDRHDIEAKVAEADRRWGLG